MRSYFASVFIDQSPSADRKFNVPELVCLWPNFVSALLSAESSFESVLSILKTLRKVKLFSTSNCTKFAYLYNFEQRYCYVGAILQRISHSTSFFFQTPFFQKQLRLYSFQLWLLTTNEWLNSTKNSSFVLFSSNLTLIWARWLCCAAFYLLQKIEVQI